MPLGAARLNFLARSAGAPAPPAVTYDIGNLTYDGSKDLTATHGTFALALDFSSDGTKMYVGSSTYDTVYQYTLSTAWDISTATYASKSMSFSAKATSAVDFRFNDAGTKIYICALFDQYVHQYNLSTAWDISTGTFSTTQQFTTPAGTRGFGGVFIADSGTKFYVADYSGERLRQYSLGTADSITSYSFVRTYDQTAQDGSTRSIFLTPDGTKMFFMGGYNPKIYQYDLGTAWNLSTASYQKQVNLSSYDATTHGFKFSSDGTKLYVIENNGVIFQFTVG